MKTLSRLLLAALAVATFSHAARAELSPQGWLETYYLNPKPAELPRAVQNLSRSGYFDRDENTAVAIGFLATVFAQNPDRVEGWLRQLSSMPERPQRLLAAALWQAGHSNSENMLRRLAIKSPVRAEVERLASIESQAIADTPVRSPSSLRLQWGAFLASGHERHIVSILEGFARNDPSLSTTARLALAQSAAGHSRVLDICRDQLERQPEEIQAEMRAALSSLAPAPRT